MSLVAARAPVDLLFGNDARWFCPWHRTCEIPGEAGGLAVEE